jgi:GT2 family glycosyltransferase
MLGPARPLPIFKHPYFNKSTDKVVNDLSIDISIKDEILGLTGGESFNVFAKDFIEKHNKGVKFVECPPSHIGGCCFIVKNELIEEIGGLIDPMFPHGSEDVDLSWRISTNGYSLGIATNVFVHHFRHKGFNIRLNSREKFKMDEYYRIPNLAFFQKWKTTIYKFISQEIEQGKDVDNYMTDDSFYDYWFLRKLNQNIGFWENGKLIDTTTNE